MSMWVTRKNLDGTEATPPILCVEPDAMLAKPGHRTLPECVAILVAAGENCTGDGTRRPIERSGRIVGYLTLTNDPHA